MDTSFLFLDDCQSNALDQTGTRISSLTGLLIPVQTYPDLRRQFYEILDWSITPAPNQINLNPEELHGSNLLRAESDERKLDLLQRVTRLVVSNRLEVYRVGYHNTKALRSALTADEDLLALCWAGLVTMLQPILKCQAIIPVMDMAGKGTVPKFSGMVKAMDLLRAAGMEQSLDIQNSESILGEVFYADSRYSIFTQLADLVSYLRHTNDLHREGRPLTSFKQQVHEISQTLQPAMIREEIIHMNLSPGQ